MFLLETTEKRRVQKRWWLRGDILPMDGKKMEEKGTKANFVMMPMMLMMGRDKIVHSKWL